MSNPNYTVLLSTTLNNYRQTLTDNIFGARPLSDFLMKKGRTRMLSGGVKIIEPIIHAVGQSGSYGGYDAIAITPQTGLSAAEFDWRQLFGTIAISGIEEAQNNGKEQLINLLEAKIMQAEETLKDSVNLQLFGDGTGNSNKEWLGLSALISGMDKGGVPARVGTASVGGIDGAAQSYWNSIIAGDADGTAVELTLATLSTPYNTASKGNDKPDAMFTTQALFEGYESILLPSVRRSHQESADAGFDNLLFKGKPIYYDDDCTAGTVYGLNSKYITLVGHKDRWFKNSGFSENSVTSTHATTGAGTVVDGRYALITSYGNLTVRNRARHFRCVNFVAAA